MIKIILSFIFCVTSFGLFAQNQPIPEYLTKQHFPDSVTSLELIAQNGKTVTLREVIELHQGKKVFIDIWASWCKDCIKGFPNLKTVYDNAKDTDFIFLSLDKDADKWATAIDKYNIAGEHYWIKAGWKNQFSSYINLDWIPRYLILDEDGMVIMPKAIEADDMKIKEMLTQ